MKMDRKLISQQQHEISYMARKLRVSQKLIRLARETAGRSRVKVTAFVKGFQSASVLAEEELAHRLIPRPSSGISNDKDF